MTRQGESGEQRYTAPGYERVEPRATYAPWQGDKRFHEVNVITREQTLVDLYRSYELWQLAAEACKVPGDILEVGVWRGGTGALIAARIAERAPDRTVYLADTFRGVVKAGPKDQYYRGGEHANASPEDVQRLVDRLELGNVKILSGVFPDDTAHEVASAQISMCHIDVDVYQGAREVTEWVWPRLPVGGIVVYDDYGFYGCEGVTTYVDEVAHLADRVRVHNLNGHAVFVKTV
ncbi:MAG: methyltransferase [Spirochaetaceae bacterium]|nr:MAG: methyltransferase [Spirochaetaceae bacterium]